MSDSTVMSPFPLAGLAAPFHDASAGSAGFDVTVSPPVVGLDELYGLLGLVILHTVLLLGSSPAR